MIKNDSVLQETFTLPSMGKIYNPPIDPVVTLRSMTTFDEMKRLNASNSDRPYKIMCNMIDDCILEDLPMSVYDMCLSDYEFLLHKLRVVTYGSLYKSTSICPFCGSTNTDEDINLDELEVNYYDDECEKYFTVELPQTKHIIGIRLQTPRLIDDINVRINEIKKKSPEADINLTYLYTLRSLVKTIDGEPKNPVEVEAFVQNLPMMDTNYILNYNEILGERIGISKVVRHTCSGCRLDYTTPFRQTSEFFRPRVDR